MDGRALSSGASSTLLQLPCWDRIEPTWDPLSEPCGEPFGDVSNKRDSLWLPCKESDDRCPDMRRVMPVKAEGLLFPEGLLEGPVLQNPDGLLALVSITVLRLVLRLNPDGLLVLASALNADGLLLLASLLNPDGLLDAAA